jgi:hypothetical protein
MITAPHLTKKKLASIQLSKASVQNEKTPGKAMDDWDTFIAGKCCPWYNLVTV